MVSIFPFLRVLDNDRAEARSASNRGEAALIKNDPAGVIFYSGKILAARSMSSGQNTKRHSASGPATEP